MMESDAKENTNGGTFKDMRRAFWHVASSVLAAGAVLLVHDNGIHAKIVILAVVLLLLAWFVQGGIHD